MKKGLAVIASPIGRPQTVDEIIAETVDAMQSLGTYKEEYSQSVAIYASLMHQHQTIMEDYTYKADGSDRYLYVEQTAKGGTRRSPMAMQISDLGKMILQYQTALMLNPKSERDAKKGKAAEPARKSLEDLLAGLEV